MIKAYKYRLKLTKSQELTIDEWINTSRAIYNIALETKIYAYNSRKVRLSKFDLMKQMTVCRKDYEWVRSTSVDCLEDCIERMDKAYISFFKGGGFPKWAKKDKYNSITFKSVKQVSYYEFKLPKIGKLKIYKDRKITGELRRATISRKNGKYFISILTKQEKPKSIKNDNQVGIDLGITFFASLSNGTQIENPRHTLKYEKQLRIESRSLSRKKQGSNSRAKQRLKVSKLHDKISRVRLDFLHKQSKFIIDNFGLIAVEDLRISNMVRFGYLSKHISDAGWGTFISQLDYKADWYGNTFIKVDPKYTSQTCSDCGEVDKKSRVSQSKFVCTSCGVESNADINASKEILKRGKGIAIDRQREALACA